MTDATITDASSSAVDSGAMARLAAAQARAAERQRQLDGRPGDRHELRPEHISAILARWWRMRGAR